MDVEKFNGTTMFIGIIWCLMGMAYVCFFIKGFVKGYSLFVPNYVKNIYDMFDYEAFVKLSKELKQNNIKSILEWWQVSEYISSLIFLYKGISYILIGVVWLIRGFRRKVIHEDGIDTNEGNYKWNRLRSYMMIEKKVKEKNDFIEYYYISFSVYNTKHHKYFTEESFKDIGFKIYPNEKEKVYRFLQSIM